MTRQVIWILEFTNLRVHNKQAPKYNNWGHKSIFFSLEYPYHFIKDEESETSTTPNPNTRQGKQIYHWLDKKKRPGQLGSRPGVIYQPTKKHYAS
jgi:hypothetical protein